MQATGLRVLVAEDEPLAAMVIEEVLASEGHAVTLAEDGVAALRAARDAEFDLLLTDLAMPRLGGLELVDALRRASPGLPVVVMTGYLAPEAAEALRHQAGPPVALLHKPFDVDMLLRLLDRLPLPMPRSAAC